MGALLARKSRKPIGRPLLLLVVALLCALGAAPPNAAHALTLAPGDLAYMPVGSEELRLARANGSDVGSIYYSGSSMRWSPDGRHVAFMGPGEYGNLQVADVPTGKVYDLGDWSERCFGDYAWSPTGSAIYMRWDMAAEPTIPETWWKVPARAGAADENVDWSLDADLFTYVESLACLPSGRLVAMVHPYDFAETSDGRYYREYGPWRLVVTDDAGRIHKEANLSGLDLVSMSNPKVSADGSLVVFSGSSAGTYSSIFTWNLVTNSVREVFAGGHDYNYYPTFTSDGRSIVWGRRGSGGEFGPEVWKMGLDGSSPFRFMSGAYAAEGRPPVLLATVGRVSGADRYATAVPVSKRGFPNGAPAVVIASGASFPDALAAAPLAKAYQGPVLLTQTASLRGDVLAELKRLAPKQVFIAGSSTSVSYKVGAQLSALPSKPKVVRFGGGDRFQTSAMIAKALKAKVGTPGRVVVVNGYKFADALSVAPLAAKKGWPILLTKPAALPPATLAAVTASGAKSSLILGDVKSVSLNVQNHLPAPLRKGGSDRYGTCALIADFAVSQGCSYRRVALAKGTDFPDALSAGAYLARNSGLVMLTDPRSLPGPVSMRLRANRAAVVNLEVLGSATSVSSAVVKQAEKVLMR